MIPLYPCLPPERRKRNLLRTASQKTSSKPNKTIGESEMSLASYVAAEEQHWAKQPDRHRAAIMAVHMLEMMGRAWSGRGWCDR